MDRTILKHTSLYLCCFVTSVSAAAASYGVDVSFGFLRNHNIPAGNSASIHSFDYRNHDIYVFDEVRNIKINQIVSQNKPLLLDFESVGKFTLYCRTHQEYSILNVTAS